MPRELTLRHEVPGLEAIPSSWRRPIVHLMLAWAVIGALFFHVLADMVMQYWNASTFNHILFVPLILAWLVRLRLPALAVLTPTAFWPGLVLMAGALVLWLLGDISGLNLATHLAFVLMLQASVIAILGPRVAWALLFPLAYSFFLVPFGDELVPTLQTITAKLTIALTIWSGIPAQIEGVFIDTPVGLFEVAEACSGVKFLIAMIALGTLAAHVCFKSALRRTLFMAAAVVLPIIANGIRAWGTIYIAQSQGIAFAAGFDHIFYGWIFFALVMALLMAASWRFFDRPSDDIFVDGESVAKARFLAPLDRLTMRGSTAVAAIVAMCLAVVLWAGQARAVEADLPTRIEFPTVEGWGRTAFADTPWWEPRASGADHRLLGSYVNAQGARVEVFFAVYSAQEEGREAGAFGEGALMPDTRWRWHSAGPDFGGGVSDRLQIDGHIQRVALTWYRHGDYLGGSVARLKLGNIADRLTVSPQPTMMLILSSTEGGPVSAEESIAEFVRSAGPLGEWMDRIAQKP